MHNYTHLLKEYRFQAAISASPIRLVVMAYDAAIAACQRRDLGATTRALSLLRNSLNFEHAEIAGRLFALYLWCADLARQDKWDEAAGILRELREAWAQAERQQPAVQSVAAPPLTAVTGKPHGSLRRAGAVETA